MRNRKNDRHIIDPDAPSAARVVYNYYGGKSRFPDRFDEMMTWVDIADSGQFSQEDILRPRKWALLNFLVDQRTNIEKWGDFRIPEARFKLDLIDYCAKMTIDEILALPDVRQRSDVYFAWEEAYRNQLQTAATVHDNIIVLDLRQTETRYPGNRFLIYALYPQCNISILLRFDKESGQTTFSVGKSIINRTSTVNVGEIMLSCGGGGHRAAGACHQDDPEAAERVFRKLLTALSDKQQASGEGE
jgi:nanoRNase/pAp phosphatase (c-di-AMP/oligoRNAs hydrolase)